MTNWNLIILLAYLQAGLFLLAFLVYRRMGELKARVAAQESGYDWSLRRAETIVAALEQRIRAFEKSAAPKLKRRSRHTRGAASLRRRAEGMMRHGATLKTLIESLKLRRPEAQLLMKLEGMRHEAGSG